MNPSKPKTHHLRLDLSKLSRGALYDESTSTKNDNTEEIIETTKQINNESMSISASIV